MTYHYATEDISTGLECQDMRGRQWIAHGWLKLIPRVDSYVRGLAHNDHLVQEFDNRRITIPENIYARRDLVHTSLQNRENTVRSTYKSEQRRAYWYTVSESCRRQTRPARAELDMRGRRASGDTAKEGDRSTSFVTRRLERN